MNFNYLSFLILILVANNISIAQPKYEWAKKIGGSGSDFGRSTIIDNLGNVYTTGYFSGTVDFNPNAGVYNLSSSGNLDIFISKLDANGNFIWAKKMGGTSNDYGYSTAIDANGNVYTTGWFEGIADFDPSAGTYNLTPGGTGDIFLSKLDANGNFVWAKKMGSPATGLPDRGYSLQLDNNGNIHITGMFIGTADFDPSATTFNLTSSGQADIFVVKLDSNGNFIWAKKMGGTSTESGHAIVVGEDGSIYTTGTFWGTTDFDPDIGVYNFTTLGGMGDIFVSKLDSNGVFVWAKRVDGAGDDVGESIILDNIGNVYLTGKFQGTADFDPGSGIFNIASTGANHDVFVLKLDYNGNFIWAKRMGGSGQDEGYSICIDKIGNIYTMGSFSTNADFNPGVGLFTLTSAGNKDIFINQLDSSGHFVWATKFGGIGLDNAYSMALDINGNIYHTGVFSATVDFNHDIGIANLVSFAGTDVYIEKIDVPRVRGRVFLDYNQNCIHDTNETGIFRTLIIQPSNIVVQADSNGIWYLDSLPVGTYNLIPDTTGNWITTCPSTQSFTILNSDSLTLAPAIGLVSTDICIGPNVSISMPVLRPGVANQKIYTQVCNRPLGTSVLSNSYVLIELDTMITVQTSSHPYTYVGNNTYQVNLAPISPGYCVDFWLSCTVHPSAALGQTLCMNAKLYPVPTCVLDTIPNPYPTNFTPCNTFYDQSHLDINTSCDNDTVQFVVVNAGSGNMNCYAPVRVYLDGVWILSDSIQLQAGDFAVFRYSGDGRTWRLEADQHPLHPGNSRPNATIERCGNLANWTPNLVNILPHDDADPVIDIYCGLVSNAYDPNDKTGYPLGIGTQHDIQPNQDLEYIINFQNTGNDTAFTVVIRDTLPMDLNIFTVQSGASSHDYTFRMYGPRVLEWTFNNIMLPDSNVNEAASHGFTSFRVRQVPNLPVGTVIENSAAIYFDLNAPVITNTSWHTIALPQDLNWNGQQTINTSSCETYTLNNFTYTNSGTYWQTSNNAGLDSLLTLNLTILDSSSATISEAICNSYTAPDGQIYTTDGQYTAIIPNALGCDSVITINLDIKEPSNNTLNEAICNSYTAPDGQIYTTDGQYTAIIPNALGCDSVITINLDIKEPSNNTLNEAICNSYTAPDGQIYTTDGQYTAIIPNALGCDSVITINLDIKEPSNNTLNEAICNSYTAPDGQIYTIDGQYTAIIPNALGCDSVITINLDIKEPSNNTLNEAICNSYTAPDGQIYTTDGQYTAIIPNALGCDSVITINLDIHDSSSTLINETVCNSYTAPDGQVYTTSGQYIALINNTLGCDSTIFINLNIDNQPSDSINLFGTTLTAYATGISYQWLDCNNGNVPIAGETNQSFTPLLSGDYAVEITNGTCSVISNCFNVNVTKLQNIENDLGILVYPNPVQSILYIDKQNNEQIHFQLMDNLGRILISSNSNEPITTISLMDFPAGVYFISINNGVKNVTQKVVKQ